MGLAVILLAWFVAPHVGKVSISEFFWTYLCTYLLL
jgi:hypothetical protein